MARTATSSGQMLSSSPASEVARAEDDPLVQPEIELPVALQPVEVVHAKYGHLSAEEVALGQLVEDKIHDLTGTVCKRVGLACVGPSASPQRRTQREIRSRKSIIGRGCDQ